MLLESVCLHRQVQVGPIVSSCYWLTDPVSAATLIDNDIRLTASLHHHHQQQQQPRCWSNSAVPHSARRGWTALIIQFTATETEIIQINSTVSGGYGSVVPLFCIALITWFMAIATKTMLTRVGGPWCWWYISTVICLLSIALLIGVLKSTQWSRVIFHPQQIPKNYFYCQILTVNISTTNSFTIVQCLYRHKPSSLLKFDKHTPANQPNQRSWKCGYEPKAIMKLQLRFSRWNYMKLKLKLCNWGRDLLQSKLKSVRAYIFSPYTILCSTFIYQIYFPHSWHAIH